MIPNDDLEGLPSDSKPRFHLTQSKRILWLIVAVGLLVSLGFAYYYFHFSQPVGKGPAGPAVSREPFVQTWSTRSVLLLGLGDSVTAGFGARKNYSYFDRLLRNPSDEFTDMKGLCLSGVLPNLLASNVAVSGSTSLDHLQKQIPRLKRANPATLGLVVITTGGNDLIHDYGRMPPREGAMYGASLAQAKPWIENFERRLETMISRVEAAFPGGCHVFLADIYDPTDSVGDIERAGLPAWKDGLKILAAYNDIIRRCAERHENVHLVNLHDAFLGHGLHCTQFWSKHYRPNDPHYWYYVNLEDPNERGYDAIRRLFLIEMSKVARSLK